MKNYISKVNSVSTIYFPLVFHIVHIVHMFGILRLMHICSISPQGSTNCVHGDKRACNMHAKKLLHAQNYVHTNQSKKL